MTYTILNVYNLLELFCDLDKKKLSIAYMFGEKWNLGFII